MDFFLAEAQRGVQVFAAATLGANIDVTSKVAPAGNRNPCALCEKITLTAAC